MTDGEPDGLTRDDVLRLAAGAGLPDHQPSATVGEATAITEVVCPECGRREEIDGTLQARAWLCGHYQAEHTDVLPAFEGVGDD